MAKYAFIDTTNSAEPGRYAIKNMCRWLAVSPSGFFTWRSRPTSATAARRQELTALVRWSFDRSNATYGYRRVHADLVRRGVEIGEDLVRDIMRAEGLVACQPRPFRTTTVPGDGAGAPDLLGRDFTAQEPGSKLVGDITYINTWAGFAYLATVIDCRSKTVIGWAVADHMRTDLVIDALAMARRNHDLAEECIFHSDRGTQYTSAQLRDYLAKHNMRSSMGRTGICWDNALAESFFAALKNELVYRTAFPTISHARKAVAFYIEVFYNRQRLHSGLGYRTPHEVHTDHQPIRSAA
jgi:transposase InsO family protein